ncbi:adenine deaminase [Propionigenium maris DSM 9537]|uniref:Adenine deaminase n=1 Tax=Propionigenium maris DSM 9537 TaxID=1123000 RepID=A0A9W6GKR9_9FUSO|nr:adenine deaminase [Propionigenium maris]GLI56143.1 adenine deaminase [Propionigenium maris DSM 9537]
MNNLREFIDVSTGRMKADIVFKNGRIINVFSHEIIEGDLAVHGGYIVGVGEFQGIHEIDLDGAYISPGLIDAHVHMESSMLSPENMAELIIPQGTTTIITDPHEIANVSGCRGIEYMLEATEDIPLNVFVNLPSCVPATPFESSGATLLADDLEGFLSHKRVLGLAEFMNFPGIRSKDPEVMKKLMAARRRGMVIDGHAPGMAEEDVIIYAGAGISTDHESETFEEMLTKIRNGLYTHIREGSAARNLEALARELPENLTRWCCLCTDDSHPETLLKEGHIDHLLKKLVALGRDPVTAIQMGTINPARCYKLEGIGALAPGYAADIVVFEDLVNFRVLKTYKDGVEVYNGKSPVKIEGRYMDEKLLSSVNVQVERKDLKIYVKGKRVNIIELIPGSLLTKKSQAQVVLVDGEFQPENNEGLLKLFTIERHHGTGNIGRGIIKNLGDLRGAIATTISHDSHNLIVAGDRDEDIFLAIEEIKRIKGGVCLVHRGRVIVSIPLEIGGIMTQRPGKEVAKKMREFMRSSREYGVSEGIDPLINLSFLALPVIPELKLTDRGLFEFTTFKHISLECE